MKMGVVCVPEAILEKLEPMECFFSSAKAKF